MIYCSKCGSEIEEGLWFCGNCGARIGSPDSFEPVNPPLVNGANFDGINAYNETVAAKTISKKRGASIAMIIGLVILVALNVVQFANNQTVLANNQDEIESLNSELSSKDAKIDSVEKDLNTTKNQLNTKTTQLSDAGKELFDYQVRENWINYNVVFRPDDGTGMFHSWNCPTWQSWYGTYWVYNNEAARSLGFRAHTCVPR
jgi:uncharacterized membrane protein YvbJ